MKKRFLNPGASITVVVAVLAFNFQGNASQPQIYPVSKGICAPMTNAGRFGLVGDYAYVSGNSGLTVVCVTNPELPVVVGINSNISGANDVKVAGDYVYAATGSGGLRVYSVTNPAAPVLIGSFVTGGQVGAYSVAIAGSYAYLSDFFYAFEGSDMLKILSVTNPAVYRASGWL